MAESASRLHHHRTVFDGWRSISLSLYMTLVGYGVLVGIPVISAAWVELLGFTESQVGWVSGFDLGGLSVGALLTAIAIRHFNRRHLVLIGAAIAIVSNALCMKFVTYEIVLWLRFAAGVGSGIYTAVAVANLGATSKPARAYNMMLFAFVFSQTLELHFLQRMSMDGIYLAFIAFFALGLPFLRWIPPRPVDESLDIEVDVEEAGGDHHVEHRHVPAYVPWLVLGAIVLTYVNIGAYWTYIKLAGLSYGIDDEWLSSVLVWVSVGSGIGCLFATLISNRFGLARPLLAALVTMAVIVGMLSEGINAVNIFISVYTFNFLWIFIDVYQMSTVANVDHSGSYASLMPGAQGLGQIIGPILAATILDAELGYSGVFIMCAMAAIGALAVYGGMYVRLRRVLPALADAS